MAARFRASGRSGFYLSVAREGELRPGDTIARVKRGNGPTIHEMLLDVHAMQTRIALPHPGADEFDPAAAAYVARLDAITDAGRQLEAQRERLIARLSRRSDAEATFRYAPDKWSVTEVVGHLADAERIFACRLLRIGRGDETPLPGFDQDPYVAAGNFDARTIRDLADEFESVRAATLSLFASLDEEAWARRGAANDTPVSVRALAHILAGHELHHMAILRERYL
jgi:uncharacterized damage-inducible protein DinB